MATFSVLREVARTRATAATSSDSCMAAAPALAEHRPRPAVAELDLDPPAIALRAQETVGGLARLHPALDLELLRASAWGRLPDSPGTASGGGSAARCGHRERPPG